VHAPLQVTSKHESLYPDLKGQRRKYAQMLTAMDEAIGRIVAAVAEGEKAARTADGVSQETLFIFSSDNGGPGPGSITDNGPYRAGKGTLYEGGVRVAAFATWKGRINAGATVTEPLHIVDWYPTLLTLAGARAEQPLPVDGRNLWPTIAEGKPSPHDAILLNATPAGGAVRAGKWKLVVRDGEDDPDNGAAPSKKRKAAVRESVELFDLAADPSERTNLAATHPGEVTRLREILHRFAGQAVRPKSSPKPKNFVSPKVWGETSESPERPRGGL
jgi:arylsulfatase A-like enzyme